MTLRFKGLNGNRWGRVVGGSKYNSGDWQSLWSRTRKLRQKSRLCTLTYSTPVDRSDTGIDIDTSFNDMVEEESSTRPPDEKGGLNLTSGQTKPETKSLLLLLGPSYQLECHLFVK